MKLVRYIMLKSSLLIMFVPPIINVSAAKGQIANSNTVMDPNNLPELSWQPSTLQTASPEMAPPLIRYDNQPIHQRTILMMGSLFSPPGNHLKQPLTSEASDQAPDKRKQLDSPNEPEGPQVKPGVVAAAAASERGLQELIIRWLGSSTSRSSDSMLKDYIGDSNMSSRRGIIHHSATTTARPAYDQIPRPLLFEVAPSATTESTSAAIT